MADELDTQETTEVQETPTSEQVPQQALFEPRNIGEAMEMDVPEPEPEPTPEPEIEAPVVEPSWLNEPAPAPAVPDAPPAQYPPQQPQYDYGYQQQPQVQQGPASDAALNALVENPDGWWEAKMAAREQQLVGPIQQQQQAIAYMMSSMIENNVNQGVAGADASIRKAYEAFNQDAAFRSNKTMQEKVGATLQGMRERAVVEARNGNFGPLNSLSNLSEADIAGTLAYVRASSGVPSAGTGPLQVEGATVESSRAPVAEQTVELTPEQEEVARRLGPGYRQRLIKGLQERDKYDDIEWKE
jgi:hypothetical protein